MNTCLNIIADLPYVPGNAIKAVKATNRDIFLKVAAVGIATMAFVTIQMHHSLHVACAAAGVVSSITLLSEYLVRREPLFPHVTSNWFNTQSIDRKKLIAFFGSTLTINLIAGIVFSFLNISVGQHVQELIKKGGARIVILATVIAPICEEIIFRGFLKERMEDGCHFFSRWIHPLSDKTVLFVSNLGQAIIFGIVHMNSKQTFKANIFILFVTTAVGFMVGNAKDGESTLLTPIGLHMALNTSVTVRLLLLGH